MLLPKFFIVFGSLAICVNVLNAQTFTQQTGANNPMNGVDVGTRSKPSLVDIDSDGDFDLFIGEESGIVNYYENTGSATSPTYTARTGTNNPFDGVDVGDRSNLGFVDIDNDGDKDCFIGERSGTFNFYRNTGSASSATFAVVTGASNPLNGFTTSGSGVNNNSDPKFVDLDNDGDWDCISGEGDGTFRYYENTGSASSATFTERTGTSNPMNGFDVGSDSSPGFVDVDSDGDWDLFSGEAGGTVAYFENTGTASSPAYTQRTGTNNPMDGFDVGNTSNITFGDVSGDGNTDSFIGENLGIINYFTGSNIGGTPLPVVLVYFNASFNGTIVELTWQTASEENHDYFTVERSIDAFDWEKLITINGAGNSSFLQNYFTTDERPFTGISYYRLKITDIDGQYTYSKLRAVKIKESADDELVIYPNPTDSQITIEGSQSELKGFMIYNILGQDVGALTKTIESNESYMIIDLSNLNPGMYKMKTKTSVNTIFKL